MATHESVIGNLTAVAEIHPLGDRLKVLPLRPPEKSAGGIVLPEASEARDRPLEGLVLAVGRGRQLESGAVVPLECQVGDVVQFGKYSGIYTSDEVVGFDVLLMREDEALGRKLAETLPRITHAPGHHRHIAGDPRCEVCRG